MITNEQKRQLRNALRKYMDTHNMSANEVVKHSGINESYISSVLNDKDTVGKTAINDKWYSMLADFIGFPLQKKHWEVKETPQLYRMLATLEDAKENGLTTIVIGETGSGKSYIADLFIKAN